MLGCVEVAVGVFSRDLDRYARQRPLDARAARQIRRAWLQAERDRSALMIGPAVVDVVGRK